MNTIIHKHFNKWLIPDRGKIANKYGRDICLLMSDNKPHEPYDQWHNVEDKLLLENAHHISDLGDDIQCFVGILAAVFSRPQGIILISNPEAFLSPSLCRNLAKELSDLIASRKASLIISTQSSDFLKGCLDHKENNNTNIVRITSDKDQHSVYIQNLDDLSHEFSTISALRSTDFLKCLFYDRVILTEGHKDRVFYEEVNRRLLLNGKGIKDCVFINADGKHAIKKFIQPFKKLGLHLGDIFYLDF